MSGAALLLALILAVAAGILWWRSREVTVIYPPSVGLLYRNGQFVRELSPGRYVHSRLFTAVRVRTVSIAEYPIVLGETTVLSQDQFSFRLALAPVLQVTDARTYVESQPVVELPGLPHFAAAVSLPPALQPRVAAAAIEAAAERTLAALLADQPGFLAALTKRLADAAPGARIDRVLLTAINLPPETRKMFTEVERARLEGQAAVERARGEQAALRVLANAARLVTDSPALANLRLLQAIETSKASTTIILGNSVDAAAAVAKKTVGDQR